MVRYISGCEYLRKGEPAWLRRFTFLSFHTCLSGRVRYVEYDWVPGADFERSAFAGGCNSGDRQPLGISCCGHVERRQLSDFSLLRTTPEGLPARMRHALRAPAFGSNWNMAQRVPVKLTGTYWIVPGRGHLCIVSWRSMGNPAIGTTCATTLHAIENGIADVTVVRAATALHVLPGRLNRRRGAKRRPSGRRPHPRGGRDRPGRQRRVRAA
jgi:hypothetical protein